MERSGGWYDMGEGYGVVLKSTMYRSGLSVEAKAIYALLATHADAEGYCFPQVETICEALEIGEDRFYRHMTKLKAAGLVEVTRKRNGYKFTHNVYRLTDRCDISLPDFTSPYNGGMIPQESYPDFTGFDGASPDFTSPCGGGTNIPSVNSTTINKTIDKQKIYMRLLSLLNEAKSNAFSKGRLKLGQRAKWVVDGLLDEGFSEAELIQRAQELAKRGSKNLDWYDFEGYCKQNHRR